jgi:hypothetical protein
MHALLRLLPVPLRRRSCLWSGRNDADAPWLAIEHERHLGYRLHVDRAPPDRIPKTYADSMRTHQHRVVRVSFVDARPLLPLPLDADDCFALLAVEHERRLASAAKECEARHGVK